MCILENKDPGLFKKRFKSGDSCVVAINEAQMIVGYEWFSYKGVHVEERLGYHVTIPQDSVYVFDCFIKPEFRSRGIWVLFKKYIQEQAGELGRERITTMIYQGNDVSLKAHLRYGFIISRSVTCIRVIHKWIFREKDFATDIHIA